MKSQYCQEAFARLQCFQACSPDCPCPAVTSTPGVHWAAGSAAAIVRITKLPCQPHAMLQSPQPLQQQFAENLIQSERLSELRRESIQSQQSHSPAAN